MSGILIAHTGTLIVVLVVCSAAVVSDYCFVFLLLCRGVEQIGMSNVQIAHKSRLIVVSFFAVPLQCILVIVIFLIIVIYFFCSSAVNMGVQLG